MITELQKRKWDLHVKQTNKLLIWGLENGYIRPYDDAFN